MSNGAWTDEENDLIVACYFAMLADDIFARRYNKAEHHRALRPLLNERSEGSIEFKHQNISAVLKGLGEDWIPLMACRGLGRFTHCCHILETGNDSFRFKASSAAASAAKEKKETTHSLTPA
jgi:hypothetical protein